MDTSVSVGSLARIAVVAASVAVAGCADDDCETVCARNAECQPDSPGKEACVDLCEELSREENYADAIAEQADCYEDATCGEIEGGLCLPDLS